MKLTWWEMVLSNHDYLAFLEKKLFITSGHSWTEFRGYHVAPPSITAILLWRLLCFLRVEENLISYHTNRISKPRIPVLIFELATFICLLCFAVTMRMNITLGVLSALLLLSGSLAKSKLPGCKGKKKGEIIGGTPIYGLYGDVPLNRVWFLPPWVWNRVYKSAFLVWNRVYFLPFRLWNTVGVTIGLGGLCS